MDHLHQTFQQLATQSAVDEKLHEFNHAPGNHVRMIQERKEVHNVISHVPWEVNRFSMTQKIYQEQRDRHFTTS